MNNIPPKLRKEMSEDSTYSKCIRYEVCKDHVCHGRITWEHVWIHAGKQVQQKWSIIPLCEYAHAVNKFQDSGIMDKEMNQWLSINRATDDELRSISKAINYLQRRDYLNKKYGIPDFTDFLRDS